MALCLLRNTDRPPVEFHLVITAMPNDVNLPFSHAYIAVDTCVIGLYAVILFKTFLISCELFSTFEIVKKHSFVLYA